MIEMRWFITPFRRPNVIALPVSQDTAAVLQFRVHTPVTNGAGALEPGPSWSEWTDVPIAKDTKEAPRVQLVKP